MQLPAGVCAWRKAGPVNKRPNEPPALAPEPANDNEGHGKSAGHTNDTVTGSSGGRIAPSPSVVALAAILGRQAARQWLREAANDNNPTRKAEGKDTEP